MNRYETVFIISPNVPDQEVNEIISSFEQVIGGGKGNLIQTDRWGKRRFAFPIKKFDEGNYILFFYEADGACVKELERKMRMNENVIRFLTSRSKSGDTPIKPTDSDYQQAITSTMRAEPPAEENVSEEESNEN